MACAASRTRNSSPIWCGTKFHSPCAPLSNVRLGLFPNIGAHVLEGLLKLGLHVSVHSDDPAYFGGYLPDNLSAVQQGLGLTNAQIGRSAGAALVPQLRPVREGEQDIRVTRLVRWTRARKVITGQVTDPAHQVRLVNDPRPVPPDRLVPAVILDFDFGSDGAIQVRRELLGDGVAALALGLDDPPALTITQMIASHARAKLVRTLSIPVAHVRSRP